MYRIGVRVFGGFIISLLCCIAVWAQATAQINGTVRDQSGAVLPGVEVTATHTDTGTVRTTVSDETGSYILPSLAVGPYRLEASLPGFRTFAQTGIVLQVNANPAINITMAVGQVTEQVEVQANASLVETRNVGVGQVIENERILELPLNGRQVTDLIVLSGAAIQTGVASSRGMQGGVSVSVGGGQSWGVGYLLDGAVHNNPYDNTNLPLPFPDALQEFKVETSGLTAQSGGHSGATVNSVTKSGTNDLHGDAFWFVRNSVFNARNFFALKRDSLKRNQFGGTVGGPIIKNKLFFFGGYQRTTTRSDPSETIRYVPTAAALAGDFTALASAACNSNRAIPLRTPFVDNKVSPSAFSRAALTISSKLPKTDDPCGKVVYSIADKPNESQFTAKIDYSLGATHSLFGRYLATTYKVLPPYTYSENVLTTTIGGKDNIAQSLTIGDTYLIGANIVNTLRLAVNQTNIHRTHKEFFSASDVGINTYSALPHYMLLNITGGFNLGGGTESEARFKSNMFQASEDLSLIRGAHQVSFGGTATYWNIFHTANVRSPGTFSHDGSVTGLGLADFLVGRPNSFTQGNPTTTLMHQFYTGLYANDTWKMTPRLVMNYGVRWEPWFPMQLTNDQIYSFDFNRFLQGVKSTKFRNAPAGLYYPGDPGFPSQAGMDRKWLGFQPRLGFAWDVNGDGRTSVRASYGMAYDFVNGAFYVNTATAPPWGSTVTLNVPTGGLENPWQGVSGGNPFPLQFNQDALFTLQGPFVAMSNYDTKTTAVHSWNLSVQRQIASEWLVSATYMGRQTTHLWTTWAQNPGLFFSGNAVNGVCTAQGFTLQVTGTCSTNGNLQQRRLLSLLKPSEGQYFGGVDLYDDGGTASYHGLLTSIQRRVTSGVSLSGNYTWSHCIGDPNGGGGMPSAGNSYVDRTNRDFDRGNCESDRRHNLNLTVQAQTPSFANPTMNIIGSGWRLSTIYKYVTGSYLTVTSGLDRALTGISSQRANQILADPYGDKSLTRYLNLAAFEQPTLGTLGNMRRANIVGPSRFQFDMALSRTFNVRENQRMEFRAEAFNVTNSLRKENPGTNLNQQNTFGQIQASADPRILQFALKYVF